MNRPDQRPHFPSLRNGGVSAAHAPVPPIALAFGRAAACLARALDGRAASREEIDSRKLECRLLSEPQFVQGSYHACLGPVDKMVDAWLTV